MCGRIEYIVTNTQELEDYYGAKLIEGYTEQGFSYPHYNIPPTAHMPLLTSDDPETILVGHWGYLPSWAKADTKSCINARAESVFEKPFFRGAITSRRCLIPVTGFFEWHREGAKKTPFRFHMNGELFSLGGVYTTIEDESGNKLPHFAIVTTEANELMHPVHDRMPVVINREKEKEWIDAGLEKEDIGTFFVPNERAPLRRDQISSLINSPKNDTAQVLKTATL